MRTILVLIALALHHSTAVAQKSEPKYEGKPLAYWIEKFQKAETNDAQGDAQYAIIAFGSDASSAIPMLVEMLKDRSNQYRARVTRILCEIAPGTNDTVPLIIKRLNQLQISKPRNRNDERYAQDEIEKLIEILGSLGPDAKEAVPAIIAALGDGPLQCSQTAIKTLCDIGPEAKVAIPAIRKVLLPLKPEEFNFVDDVVSNLYKLGPDVAPLLLDLLRVSNTSIQLKVFDALIENHQADLKKSKQLEQLLKDRDPVARYYAACLVWKLNKDKIAITVFADLLKEQGQLQVFDKRSIAPRFPGSEPSMRYLAAEACDRLAELGPDAKEALIALKAALKFQIIQVETKGYPAGMPRPYASSFTTTGNEARAAPENDVQIAAKEAIKKIAEEPKR